MVLPPEDDTCRKYTGAAVEWRAAAAIKPFSMTQRREVCGARGRPPRIRESFAVMALASACADAMSKPGVTGVLCVDSQGLCLHSQGAVPDASSGSIVELAQHAALVGGGDASTVVSVESAQRKVLISKSDGITTAIFMQPTASK